MNLYFIEMDVAIILVTALHMCISKKKKDHTVDTHGWCNQQILATSPKKGQVKYPATET